MQREAERLQLETMPPEQMANVLRVAAELHAREQTQRVEADERRQLLQAAAEVGLPPEYLERAAALIAEAEGAKDATRRLERARPRRMAGVLAQCVAVGLVVATLGQMVGRQGTASAPPPPTSGSTALSPPVAARLIGPCIELDLSRHVTHRLDEPMLGRGNHLGSLLAGLREEGASRRILNGVPFRMDGVLLVGPGETSSGEEGRMAVRPQIEGIPIERNVQRLHFLHGTHWRTEDGTLIGAYIVHYEDGTRLEIPIRYGEDVRDWWVRSDPRTRVTRARVVWSGSNEASSRLRSHIRLFVRSWENPYPKKPITSLDMVTGEQPAGPAAPAPFLVGLTAEQESETTRAAPPAPATQE